MTKTSVTLNADLNSTGGLIHYRSPFSGSTVPGMLLWMDGNDPDEMASPILPPTL